MCSANRILPGLFISHFDEAVASDSTKLCHFVENSLFVIIYLPYSSKTVGHNALRVSGSAKVHSITKSKPSKVVQECAVIVNRNLHFALLAAVAPVVTEVHSPVQRVTVKSRTVDFKFFVSQLYKPKRRDADCKVRGSSPIAGGRKISKRHYLCPCFLLSLSYPVRFL